MKQCSRSKTRMIRSLSWRNRNFQDAVTLVAEQIVCRFDVAELEAVRDHPAQVGSARLNHGHQTAHAFLAPRVQVEPASANAAELAEAIKDAGYTPAPVEARAAGAQPAKAGGCCGCCG
jgi:hypothetical protein